MAATPKWDLDDALNRGRAADRLLDDHSDVLTPELEDGLGARLKADLAFLSVENDGRALGDQRTATATEREIAKDAHDLIMLVRRAVQRSRQASESLRTAMGVGTTLHPGHTRQILNGLGAIATHADALRAIHVPTAVITEAADLAAQLQAADASQSEAIKGRASSTDARRDAHLRIEEAVDAIHVAGLFLFRKDPAKRARFEALVSSSGPGRSEPSEPSPAPTA